MAIVDNEGQSLNMDNIDDISEGPSPVEIPDYTKNEEQEEQDLQNQEQEQEQSEEQKVTFDPATDDLLNEEDEEEEEENSEETSPEAEFYKGVGTILKTKGLISEEVNSEADLVKAIENEVSARLDKKAKMIEEYMHAGVPYQAVAQVQNAISQTESITEEQISETPELAKALIVSNFVQRGFDQEEAEGYYDDFVAAGTAVEKAIAAKTVRLKSLNGMLEEEVIKAKNAASEREQREQALANSVEKRIEEGEILGRKLTQGTQTRLKNILTNIVDYDAAGNPLNEYMKYKLENPVEFETNLIYLYTVTNGFKDLKAFDRNAQTRISRQFRDAVSTISSGKSFVDSPKSKKTSLDINTIDDIIIPNE